MLGKSKLIAKSMIICDSVLQDIRTGKKSLIGIFNKITGVKAPVRHTRLNIFIVLTEGIGEYDCELRCVNSNTLELIAKLEGKIALSNPNHIFEMNFELDQIIFPTFGNYRFEFIAGGELINACQFEVAELNQKKG